MGPQQMAVFVSDNKVSVQASADTHFVIVGEILLVRGICTGIFFLVAQSALNWQRKIGNLKSLRAYPVKQNLFRFPSRLCLICGDPSQRFGHVSGRNRVSRQRLINLATAYRMFLVARRQTGPTGRLESLPLVFCAALLKCFGFEADRLLHLVLGQIHC